MHTSLILALGFAAFLPASCVPGVSGGPGFSLLEERQSSFTYTGATGPLLWGRLSPANSLCSTGNNQSPINIDGSIPTARISAINYPNVQSATLKNTGKTIELEASSFSPLGTLTFEGREYTLDNIHIHVPSEHRIFEEFFVLEAHFVHRLRTNPSRLLVTGVVFELTRDSSNPLISNIMAKLSEIRQPNTETETGPLNFDAYENFIRNTPLYRYSGSLTTPPCSEGVQWLVATRFLDLDVGLFNLIKDIVKFNSRYTQNTPGQPNLLELACGT